MSTAQGLMTLANITSGKLQKAIRQVIYGTEGVGKTSYAAKATAPVFIGTEDGTSQLDVSRFPSPQNWDNVFDAIDTLYSQDHDFKTVVLDSADWALKLCVRHVCAKANVESIEDIPYGRGHIKAAEEFQRLLRGLDALVSKGMHVVVIAHSEIVTFKDPAGDAYDHYTIACGKRVTPMLKEWADCVFFADFDKSVRKVGEGFNERTIAKSYGNRIMYTEHRASHDAKNRFGLPERMALDWNEFEAAVNNYFNQ